MERDVLDELVEIWECWTNIDPVLRQALQSREVDSTVRHELQGQVLEHLHSLAESTDVNEATSAALSAGWAVLLALEGASAQHLRRFCSDARMAHQHALAQLAEGTRGPNCN